MGPKVVVVTGTDTGVGKTLVTAGLARALVRAGRTVVAIKPVESGCDGSPAAEDGAVLARAAEHQAEPARPRAALVRCRAPLAPALAAEREGIEIDVDALSVRIRELAGGADVALVEGAGGLLSPLSWEHDVTHLAASLGAATLVVAADRLGVLSHARLVIAALDAAGLPPIGVVLSAPAEPDASTGSNAAALGRALRGRPTALRLLELPRVPDVEAAADHLAEVMAWLELPGVTSREAAATRLC